MVESGRAPPERMQANLAKLQGWQRRPGRQQTFRRPCAQPSALKDDLERRVMRDVLIGTKRTR